MAAGSVIDYGSRYDGYWRERTKAPQWGAGAARMAALIAETCGTGRAIDIGCGQGVLVGELLRQGIDTIGLDVSQVVVERAGARWPGRIVAGSALSIPFPDGHFDTVVSTHCLEHLAPADVAVALREMYRVSSRYVFLQIDAASASDELWRETEEGRAWWETRCLEAGFRKHALYYRANPYEALNEEDGQIVVLLEKVQADALQHFDVPVLVEERLLDADMLREISRRSDAHCIRYHKAAEFIRPGDRVLDVACGQGYGSSILYAASQAHSVLGIDLSDSVIAYAAAHYGRAGAVAFRVGDVQTLEFIADHSVDFIAAFGAMEQVPDPMAYLRALKRVLKPAGRVMIGVTNEWTDETGPHPHHLHVYTWERLVAECGAHFLLEQGFLQTAGDAVRSHQLPRKWVNWPVDQTPDDEAEWVLLLGMADPIQGQGIPYQETAWVLPDSADFHVSAFARDYANPWLVKGMVAMGMRARSASLVEAMQDRVLGSAGPESVDYGAALCGRVYAWLSAVDCPTGEREALEADARRYAAIPGPSPHQLRWQVSLLFACGEFARRQGRLADAIAFFSDCAARDVVPYSPLLGNKVVDALYWLAAIALCRHDTASARAYLLKSVGEVQRLVSGPWLNILGSKQAPLPFGLAEAAQLLDKASRAAYMLSVLDGHAERPGLVHQESMGFFERQLVDRDQRLAEARNVVDALMLALDGEQQTIQRLTGEVQAQDANAQKLAREVVKQDAHAQSLAREVAAQDARAQELAREVGTQHARAQELAREVAAQDARAQELAREVVAQDARAQTLAREVAERDARTQEFVELLAQARLEARHSLEAVEAGNARAELLAREVVVHDERAKEFARELIARDADASQLAIDVARARSEAARLLEIVRKQDAVLVYFRPRLWPGIVRRIFKKK